MRFLGKLEMTFRYNLPSAERFSPKPCFQILASGGIHFRRGRLNLPNPFGFLSVETNERTKQVKVRKLISSTKRFAKQRFSPKQGFSQTDNYTANTLETQSELVEIIAFLVIKIRSCSQLKLRSSPRPISIGQLHALPHFHPRPINLIVFKGSYYLTIWDTLS